jgi:hypothetical protein
MKMNKHLATKTENKKLSSFPLHVTQTLPNIEAFPHPQSSRK